MLYSCTPISQHIPVVTNAQHLNTPKRSGIQQHVLDRQKFLELYSGYSNKTGQASKNDIYLVQPYPEAVGGEGVHVEITALMCRKTTVIITPTLGPIYCSVGRQK